jgi:hypothetical protein
VPPTLLQGGFVEFDSALALAALIDVEIAHRRLLCINLADAVVDQGMTLTLRVRARAGEVQVVGRGVFRQADLLGLELDVEPETLRALRRLVGPAALMQARAEAEARSAERTTQAAAAAPADPIDPIDPRAPAPSAPVPRSTDEEDLEYFEQLTLPPSEPVPGGSSTDTAGFTGIWVETTQGDFAAEDLGGLLDVTGAHAVAMAPVLTPLVSVDAGERGESGAWTTGHGLGFFVGRKAQVLRGLRDLAGRSGRLVLGSGDLRCTLELDTGRTLLLLDAQGATPEVSGTDARARQAQRIAQTVEALSRLGDLERSGAGVLSVSWSFAPGVTFAAVPLTERPAFVWVALGLTDALLARVALDELAEHFEESIDQWPRLRGVRGLTASGLATDKATVRLVNEQLDGARTLREVLTMSPLGRMRTLRFLALLDGLGLIDFEDAPPEAARAQEGQDLLRALRDRAKRAREDHFAALGVHYASHPDELKPGLERIVSKYGPSTPVAAVGGEIRVLCEEIVARARAAFEVLSVRAQRVTYREQRVTGLQLVAAADLLQSQMKLAAMRKDAAAVARLIEVLGEIAPDRLTEG